MIRDVRNTPPQPGVDRVYAPGERSHARWLAAQARGLAVPAPLARRIEELAGERRQPARNPVTL